MIQKHFIQNIRILCKNSKKIIQIKYMLYIYLKVMITFNSILIMKTLY